NDVKRVLRALPEERQTLLFSATMPREIEQLAQTILRDPVTVKVDPVTSTVDAINQCIYFVDKANKRHLLAELIKHGGVKNALVFTRTKHGADRVVKELATAGIDAMAIHGNKSQTARQSALAKFKSERLKVLVATDIAARGIDVPELSHVFNYDLPNEPELYIHRIGRTGRAGLGGDAVSFCCYDELDYLKDIEKLTGQKIAEKPSDFPMKVLYKTEKPTQQRGSQWKTQNSRFSDSPRPRQSASGPRGRSDSARRSFGTPKGSSNTRNK
ncbi:MAG: helicase-related protein, partial [Oscillospiraceae bacterium]